MRPFDAAQGFIVMPGFDPGIDARAVMAGFGC
jgi:hypothetical protein